MAYQLKHVGASVLADTWTEETAEAILDFASVMMEDPADPEPEFEIWWYAASNDPKRKGGVKFTWDAENNDYEFAIEDVLDQGVEVHFQSFLRHVIVEWVPDEEDI